MIKSTIVTVLSLLVILGCNNKDEPDSSVVKEPSKYILINGVDATRDSFQKIADTFGKKEDKEIAVGVGFIISYLRGEPSDAALRLKRYLSLSEEFALPIIVQLDGEQWWQGRPDLWNWWDENKPGYNPENRKNVEWTNWTSDSAVKIGWRNWGRQLRVLPMPNLMSSAYREACHVEMEKLVPIIMDWWNSLPQEKKYLLVGVKIGWESAIGVNNWYYPGGNNYLNEPEANDPTYGTTINELPGRGVTSIGYAAVKTAGLANSGDLKEADVASVVHAHLEDLCKQAFTLGVPRDRLFTHAGGWAEGELLYEAAVNQYSCPGWSFYQHASNPANDITAMKALKKSDAPYWGAVEWLYQGQKTQAQWEAALGNTLSVPGIKYLNIYNWKDIKSNANAISAIQKMKK